MNNTYHNIGYVISHMQVPVNNKELKSRISQEKKIRMKRVPCMK